MPNKFYMDVHDFGFLMPGMDEIIRMQRLIPDFKMTAFTIPFPKEFFQPGNQKHFKVEKYKKWAEVINSYEWLEIGLHGFAHTHFEMTKPYDTIMTMLTASENMFERIGLNYKKICCAPYWQYSYDAFVALRDKGYIVAINSNHPRNVPEGTKTFQNNWSFEEMLPDTDIIVGHGHCGYSPNVKNNLDACYQNIITNVPADASFGFISEDYVEINKLERNINHESK